MPRGLVHICAYDVPRKTNREGACWTCALTYTHTPEHRYQHQYEDIAACEERNVSVFGGQIEMDAKPSEVYYGSGRFTREQALSKPFLVPAVYSQSHIGAYRLAL